MTIDNPSFSVTPESWSADFPILQGGYDTHQVIVTSGQNLIRGNLVGLVTATGKVIECDPDVVDGSQVIYGVLLRDVDATSGDVTTEVAINGVLNYDNLNANANFASEAALRHALRVTDFVLPVIREGN